MQLTPESSHRPEDPLLPAASISLPLAVLLAAVALFFALGGVVWLSLKEERRSLIEQAYAQAEIESNRLALQAAAVLGRVDKAMQVIDSVRENGNPFTLDDLAQSRVISDEIASAFLTTDRKGMVIETTSADVVLNLGDDDDFKRLATRSDSGLVIGQPTEDHIRGGWVIPLMRRIDGGAGFDGVVVALLRPDALIPGGMDGPGDAMVRTVFGLDGFIRARKVQNKVRVEGRVPYPERQIESLRLMRVQSKIGVSPIDGSTMMPVATAISGYPLVALAASTGAQTEALYAEARDRTLAWGSAAALLLLVGAATLWQQARQLETSRRAARRATALYEATLEGSLDSLWLMNPVRDAAGDVVDFVVIEANQRSLDMRGWSREQVIGHTVGGLLPSSKENGLLSLLTQVHRTQTRFDAERPGRSERLIGHWLHVQAVPAGDGVALITRDITERRHAAQQLAEREAFLRTLLDALPVPVYAKSARAADQGQVRFWNKAAEQQYGLTAAQAIGKTTEAYLNISASEATLQDAEVARERRVMSFKYVPYEAPSGTRYLDFLKAPVLGADGEIDMILVIAEDVTDQRAAAEQLRLVSRVVQESGDAVLLTDLNERVVLANAAFAAITGRPFDGLLGANALDVGLPALRNEVLAGVERGLEEQRHWAGESRLPRMQGAALETWLNISAIADEAGNTTHHAWLFSDISVLKAQERQLAELARRDPLTQLSNRRHFEEELEAAAARARRHGHPLALVYLDLDGFKQVNDSLGHEAGDRLLIEVARRLRAAVRSTDLVSRLGGDEFTVILEHAGTETDRAQECKRLLDELSRPHMLAGRSIVCTPSIGVALYQPGEHTESLRHRADVAMYEAKRSGKGKVRTAEPALT